MSEKVSKKIEGREKKLSLDEIKKIIFLSYMFSQQDGIFQDSLLTEIRRFYGRQKKLNKAQRKEVSDYILNSLRKLVAVGGHAFVSEDKMDEEPIDDYIVVLSNKDNKYGESFDKDHTRIGILESFLGRDLNFKNRKRKNVGDELPNSSKDKHGSFFVSYILRDKKTGDEGFDSLFSDLRSTLSDFLIKVSDKRLFAMHKQYESAFFDVINNYNNTHPDSKVTVEELAKLGILLTGIQQGKLQ